LVDLTDDGLLGVRATVAPDVVLLRQAGGCGRVVRADTALAALVGACDGELTVGQIARALAELLERPTQDVVSGLLPAVRALVADGLLTII
jgi:hypothetical protein